jgi:TonB family protein
MSSTDGNSTDRQSDLLLWIAAGAIAAIAIAWFAVARLGQAPAGVATTTVSGEPVVTALATGPDEADTPFAARPRRPADGKTALASNLDNPLRAAQMAYEAGMLTEPENYSAWTLFGEALEADPTSAAARQGLEQVADDLLTRGMSAIEQGRYEDATAIADRILLSLPAHAGAEALRQSIIDAATRRRARRAARIETPPVSAGQQDRAGTITAPRLDADNGAEPEQRGPSPGELLNRYRDDFESAVTDNRLLAPADESAKHFVLEMRGIDASDTRTVTAADWLITEMLGRSRQAAEATDWAAAETWLDEAETLGAPVTALVETRTRLVSMMAAAETAKRLPVAELALIEYVPPVYPRTALSRGIEGWVDLNFRVTSGGTTTDITVADSSHERMFQNEAIDAVRQWMFAPRTFMGLTIDQNTYARVRFALSDE